MMKKNAPKTIDEYLGAVRDEDHRRALEKLRKQIKAAAPRAEECISYQMPAFRQNGMLVFFGNASKHCAFYPGSTAIETHKDELKDYELSKGTIRFQPNKPLPAALVRAIVKERLAENQRKAKKRR
jgi:uncharacterized protein YdhG (YjbR/CyaY superfamily)